MYILRFIYIYMYVYAHRHLYSTEKICCPSSSATAIWGATNDSTAHGMPLRQTEDCSLTAVQKLWDLTQWMLGSLDDVAVRRTQFCPQTEVRWIRRVASGVCYSLCKRRKKSITYFSIHTWFYVLWMCWLCMYTYTYIYIYAQYCRIYSQLCFRECLVEFFNELGIRQSIHFPNFSCWHRLEIGEFASHKLTKAGLKAIATGAELEVSPASRPVWCRFQLCCS